MTFLHKITQNFLRNKSQNSAGISQQPKVVKQKTLAELEQEIAAQAQLSNTPQKKTHNKAKRGIGIKLIGIVILIGIPAGDFQEINYSAKIII